MKNSNILISTNLILSSGNINNNAKKMITNNHKLRIYIENNTTFILPPIIESYKERLFCITNNISAVPTCLQCNKKVMFVHKKYQKFCSSVCANTNPDDNKKRRLTNMNKYGGPAPLCNNKIKEKSIATNLRKYGFSYHQQSPNGKQQRANTNMLKYGSCSPFGSLLVQQKSKDTMMQRFGNESFPRSQISPKSLNLLKNKQWMKKMHIVNKLPIYKIADMVGVSSYCVRDYMTMHNIQCIRFFVSAQHEEIVDFIKSHTPQVTIINNDRTLIYPHELDIFIPELNLAFEINGLFWHGEQSGKNRNYHNDKSINCHTKGIRLIHITDFEWKHKRSIVESRILAILNKTTKIYARQCNIIILDKATAKTFFNDTHMQGSIGHSICYGLLFNGVLVCAMSFGVPRYTKNNKWELLRFSTKLDHTIIGGASKLFTHFIIKNSPTSIISYSDRRWNTGRIYNQLGFVFQYTSAPNYHYFIRNNALYKMWHRSNFQKHKLQNKLKVFDSLLSEYQNMINNGYDRIWDCGNQVFLWENK